MKIPFWKMQAAGNDFILVDDRERRLPDPDPVWIRKACDRHRGIGAEGFILLRPAGHAGGEVGATVQADCRMVFFNPDGAEADMCGNGVRCLARLAHRLGVAGERFAVATKAGGVRVEIVETGVKVWMPAPREWMLHEKLAAGKLAWTCHGVNTGVPHAVIEANDVAVCPIEEWGNIIRHHARFAPKGTNVNFMKVEGPHELRVRTYERGVEAETPACGTGATACALIAGKLGQASSPVRVRCAGGDVLLVEFRLTAEGAEDVALSGPAEFVFAGEMDYP
ncbi:MAG: diaminopimelate epimerase [Lentisphaerae bacterium]|nr:diaminopimelate epimerase [Lentisphaerota bacterium]